MSTDETSTGALVLTGGEEFAPLNAPRSVAILDCAPSGPLAILAAAAAFEGLAAMEAQGVAWARANHREPVVLSVVQHRDATEQVAAQIREAAAILICDGSPLHLRSVLKGSPLIAALHDALAGGAVVIASGSSATVFGDPMVDPRGGAYTVGLGFAPGLAILPGRPDTTAHLLERAKALQPTGSTLVGIDEGAALTRRGGEWSVLGDGHVVAITAGVETRFSAGDRIAL